MVNVKFVIKTPSAVFYVSCALFFLKENKQTHPYFPINYLTSHPNVSVFWVAYRIKLMKHKYFSMT